MKILSALLMTTMTVTLFGCFGSEETSTSNEDTSSGSKEVLTSKDASESNESSASKEVTIGKQVWMTENLNVDKFLNGDPIPQAKTAEEWAKAGKNGEPAWCYYDNDPANGEKYGKIYNWYAVNDPRGLSPEGWHIPSDVEWVETINHLGGENEAGIKMKNTSGWFKMETVQTKADLRVSHLELGVIMVILHHLEKMDFGGALLKLKNKTRSSYAFSILITLSSGQLKKLL